MANSTLLAPPLLAVHLIRQVRSYLREGVVGRHAVDVRAGNRSGVAIGHVEGPTVEADVVLHPGEPPLGEVASDAAV